MMLMMSWRPQGLMPPKSRRYGVAALLDFGLHVVKLLVGHVDQHADLIVLMA